MVFHVTSNTITTKAAVDATPDLVSLSNITTDPGTTQVRVACGTVDAVIKFGNSSVVASNTYTGDDLVDGNVVILAGSVEVFQIPGEVTHASIKREDSSSTGGKLFIQAGKSSR